ncbi:MAG: metal-dependent hydrolase [Gammaproteobacteria bacterium]|nr:metal-dependent hydrolase [Gammaproteobacteria bacterium]
MDPLSQAVLGATLSQSSAGKKLNQLSVMVVGALAGMAPDLDAFIRSETDPLLFLDFHRQFTHSLAFIPLGALVCALVFYYFWFNRRWAKVKLSFLQVYLFSFIGYATHGFLDANTSYGTQLLWPFSNERIAWDTVSIVDPLLTLPLVVLVVLSVRRKTSRYARIALVYAVLFLSFGLIQQQRAEQSLMALSQQRGHTVERLLVKPSFGNRHVWKMIYEYDGHYYVDAVRLLWDRQFIKGDSIQKLDVARDLPYLSERSQSAKDIERFRWSSNDFLALNPDNTNQIIDVRNSMLPNSIQLLFGIELNREKLENGDLEIHVNFVTNNKMSKETRSIYLDMLF